MPEEVNFSDPLQTYVPKDKKNISIKIHKNVLLGLLSLGMVSFFIFYFDLFSYFSNNSSTLENNEFSQGARLVPEDYKIVKDKFSLQQGVGIDSVFVDEYNGEDMYFMTLLGRIVEINNTKSESDKYWNLIVEYPYKVENITVYYSDTILVPTEKNPTGLSWEAEELMSLLNEYAYITLYLEDNNLVARKIQKATDRQVNIIESFKESTQSVDVNEVNINGF